jgi:hypothetical protein
MPSHCVWYYLLDLTNAKERKKRIKWLVRILVVVTSIKQKRTAALLDFTSITDGSSVLSFSKKNEIRRKKKSHMVRITCNTRSKDKNKFKRWVIISLKILEKKTNRLISVIPVLLFSTNIIMPIFVYFNIHQSCTLGSCQIINITIEKRKTIFSVWY